MAARARDADQQGFLRARSNRMFFYKPGNSSPLLSRSSSSSLLLFQLLSVLPPSSLGPVASAWFSSPIMVNVFIEGITVRKDLGFILKALRRNSQTVLVRSSAESLLSLFLFRCEIYI